MLAGGFCEPRLPDARLAGHGEDTARTPLRPFEDRGDRVQLVLTADECAPQRAQERRGSLAEQLPGEHGLALSFERELADGRELESVGREAVREVADVRLALRRSRLQPLGEDHGVAEHGVVHARLAPEDARDAVPGVDAAVQRELCVVRKRLAEPGELAMHLEGDQERSLGVVLVGDRRPEEREQSVAGELLDVAAVAADDAAEGADDRIDDLEQVLGVEPVGKRRESRDVREERRDEPPLLWNLSPASMSRSATGPATKLRSASATLSVIGAAASVAAPVATGAPQ